MKTLTQHVFFSTSDLQITETPYGVRFLMKGCDLKGEPGAPAFPVKSVRIALPPNKKAVKLRWKVIKSTLVTQQKTEVACIQPVVHPVLNNPDTENGVPVKFALPDEKKYLKAFEEAETIAVLGAPLQIGNIPIATVDIWPLHYLEDGVIECVDHVVLTLGLEDDKHIFIKPQITREQRYQEHAKVHDLVINPERVLKTPLHRKRIKTFDDILPEVIELPRRIAPATGRKAKPVPKQVDYLIITDNNKWNSETVATTGVAGNLLAEFERLAAHKKKRGYRTHIAEISDIVAGQYGNFTAGARDLQEVIRNFLKQFVVQKGVEWLLLGGDISIIPPRLACASAWGRIEKGSLTDTNVSEWSGTYLKMRVDRNVFGRTTDHLTNYLTGQLIPYDFSGTSNATTAGWYHTTNNTFSTRTATRTEWIRVNGPAAVVNAVMNWYTATNMIPTDMYYSSLYGPHYNTAGHHDWDLLNNGLYGQHNHTNTALDGVDFMVDVGIGRAPVESAAEAKTFVDKVIEYDNWGHEHTIADYNRFKKMLFVAEHWARYFHTVTPQSGNTFPPANMRFSTKASDGYALIHDSSFIGNNPGEKIVCNYSDSARKVLQFTMDADSSTPGWYFAKSATDLQPSYTTFTLMGVILFKLPVPTEWVVVYGPAADISPMSYDIDKASTDSSVTQQEELREYVKNNLSRINQVERLYSDVSDVPVGSMAGATLKKLTKENLENALNDGPHFVSLTGHGNSDGVAHLNRAMANSLTNGNKTFIAIADSCLTNQYDVDDAMGETLLKNSGGGAVAYVGNSRYSWIGIGDDFRYEFFRVMKYWRNLARLNDSRTIFRNDTNYWQYQIWTILEQTLMGDPEMNVYRTDEDAFPKYIGNKNTMELHESTCQWVKWMANWNKRYYDSIEEGLALGYDGCAFCLKEYDHG